MTRLRFSKSVYTVSIPKRETPSPHSSLLVPCPTRRGCVLLTRSANRQISAREILLGGADARHADAGAGHERCCFGAHEGSAWLVNDEALCRLDLDSLQWTGKVDLPPKHRIERIIALDGSRALLVDSQGSLLAQADDDARIVLQEADLPFNPDTVIRDGANVWWVSAQEGRAVRGATAVAMPPMFRAWSVGSAVVGVGARKGRDGQSASNNRLLLFHPRSGATEVGECAVAEVSGQDLEGRLAVLTAPSTLGDPYFPWPDYPERLELWDITAPKRLADRAVRGQLFGLDRHGSFISLDFRGPRSHRLHVQSWSGEVDEVSAAGWTVKP